MAKIKKSGAQKAKNTEGKKNETTRIKNTQKEIARLRQRVEQLTTDLEHTELARDRAYAAAEYQKWCREEDYKWRKYRPKGVNWRD